MRPQRLTLLWQRSGRPGSFYAPTLHEPAYLLARVSRARPNQHRHRLLQATAFCILLQPPPRKRTQPVLQSPSQITVSIHAFTQAACAGRAGLSPKRRNPLTKVVICSQPHQESHRRHSLSLFIFLSSYLCLSLSRLSSFSLRGALPLALDVIYFRSRSIFLTPQPARMVSCHWLSLSRLSPVVLDHSWAVERHMRRPEPSDAHWASGGPVGERPRRRHLAAAAGDASSDHAPNTAPRFPTWPSRDSAANFTSCCRAAFVASF